MDENDVQPLMILLTAIPSAVMLFQWHLTLITCIFSLVSIEIYEFTLFLILAVLSLTPGPHTCWASALLLHPLHQPCLVLHSLHDRVSRTIFPELASIHDPPDFYLLSHLDYRCEPPACGFMNLFVFKKCHFVLLFLFIYFWGTGVWTQGLVIARLWVHVLLCFISVCLHQTLPWLLCLITLSIVDCDIHLLKLPSTHPQINDYFCVQ
jgi:hypothetical protein